MTSIPIFPISLLQPDDLELLELLETTPDAWLFLGEVMAAVLPHLAQQGLVPARVSATSVAHSLTDGRCVALEMPLREPHAEASDPLAFSLTLRAGIYLGLEDSKYWTHSLLLWVCPPNEAADSWPPSDVQHGALRLAGVLHVRQSLAGRVLLEGANAELREEMTRYGSTLDSLCREFCSRMSASIEP